MESVNNTENPDVEVVDIDGDSPVCTNPDGNENEIESKSRSAIWEKFEIVKSDNKHRAVCWSCKEKSFAMGTTPDGKPCKSTHGTSNMHKHLKVCNAYKKQFMEIKQMQLDYSAKLRSKKISQDVYREKMGIAILKHNYPFSIVEHEGLREVHSYLNAEVKPYTRNTAKADCLKIALREKEVLKLALARISGKICLTADVWTSIRSEGYLCLTAHFVDENWKLHSRILNFSHFPPPHSGKFLCDKAYDFLKDWGIEKKVFSITLDNASSCDNMQDHLKNLMLVNKALVSNGDYFHIRCSAHILNLIVQDGLKVGSEAIYKIRESIKYVKGSESRLIKFAQCCEQVGVSVTSSMGLRMDVPTRWNSTFFMLECAVKFRLAFVNYSLIESNYKYCPTNEEWDRGVRIAKFLAPFAVMTNLVSGTEYPTANLYFNSVWRIQLRIIEEMESEDLVLRSMATEMYPKFLKYWESYSVILAMATVLDPRYKLEFVEYCYNKIDAINGKEKGKELKKSIEKLYQEYVFQNSVAPKDKAFVGTSDIPGQEDDTEEYFKKRRLEAKKKSDLDLYLEEPPYDCVDYAHLDILEYWKDNRSRYPVLSNMARDIMSIPITTVASESSFSIGAKVLNKYRSSLTPDNAQALVCGRNWLFGNAIQSEDPEDSELMLSLPSSASMDGSLDARSLTDA